MEKFQIRTVATGIKFDLKAANGEIVATSEVYKTSAACHRGMESVQNNIRAPLEDETDPQAPSLPNPKFQLYQDRSGAFRFRLRSRNSRIIAASEGYETRSACLGGIASLCRNVHGQTDEISGE